MDSKRTTEQLDERSLLSARLRDIADTWFPESQVDGSAQKFSIYDLLPDNPTEEFGLVWPGKHACIDLLRRGSNGALEPDVGKSLNWEEASHALCIGENLEILKLLQPAYFGRVKAAFIDPPYNVESDRVYIDDIDDPIGAYLKYVASGEIKDAEQLKRGRRHSTWLSMMLPRLFAVRNLLRDDGVVFVVIDDHECHRLRMLMDEVFGEENFVCTFIWQKRYAPAPDAENVGYVHENILCYRKTDSFAASLLPMTSAQKGRYTNRDNDPNGAWKPADYTCRFTAKERRNLYYPIKNPNTGEDVWPKKTRVWACSQEEHEKNVKRKAIWWPKTAKLPARKAYLDQIKQGAMPRSLLLHEDVGHTDEATKELRQWLPNLKITPKPTRLLAHLLTLAGAKDDDIILDVFARVGTTMEAVARLNSTNNSRLRTVLVQSHERLKSGQPTELSEACRLRSIAALRKLGGKSSGLRVFRLVRSSLAQWNLKSSAKPEEILAELNNHRSRAVKGATDDQLLYELLLQAGVELTSRPTKLKAARTDLLFFESESVVVTLAKSLKEDALEQLLATDATTVICRETALHDDVQRVEFTRRLNGLGKTLHTV
jgi:adenine-specific DNA-methyltransferase